MSNQMTDDVRPKPSLRASFVIARIVSIFSKAAVPAPAPRVDDEYTRDLSKKLALWLYWSKFWSVIHWLVGTTSVALSAVNAIQHLVEPYRSIVAVSTTITVGFLGFANPQRLANRHVRAYVILDPALRDYRMGLLDAKTLTQIHRQAEATLHGTGDNPTPATS